MSVNHYETLEVSTNASPAVIRAAYKSLMQRYHPDRNPDDAETAQHTSRIVQAYEVLSDVHLRAAYDIALKQQTAVPAPLRAIPRAAIIQQEHESRGYLWVVMAVLMLVGLYFFAATKPQHSPADELKAIRASLDSQQLSQAQIQTQTQRMNALLQAHPELARQAIPEKGHDTASRTRPQFISNLNIKLRAPASDSAAQSAVPAEQTLTIQTLGVTVGSFDADQFMRHIESNREFIAQKLAEKLVDAQYDRLTRNDAELYLKLFILDALNDITQTNRNEDYPPSKTESPGRYGVIAVSLPESFSVKIIAQ